MDRSPRIWSSLLTFVALSVLVGCQGFSAAKPATSTTTTSPPASLPGDLAAAPTTITFGNVQVGTTQSQTDTLTNTGGSDLTISQATVTGTDFSISGLTLPMTLAAGASATVTITFSPQSVENSAGSLALTNDASSTPLTIALTAVGVAAGSLSGTPTSFSFSSIQIGKSQTKTETLNNTGGESITISQATATNPAFSYSGIALPLTLAAGDSSTFSVVFTPTAAGSSNGLVSLTVSGSSTTFDIAVSGTGVPPASLSASPESLQFSSVQLGSSQTLTETLNNSGGESVTVTAATATGSGFSYSGLALPLTLASGQSSTFGVVFDPSSVGSVSGTLSLTLNGSNAPVSIALSGTGIAPATLSASPASLNFSSVEEGKSQTQSTTITNTGGTDATLTQDSVTGTGFSLSGLSLPVTLAAGKSTSLSVTFAPQNLGSVSGSAVVNSNASNPNLTISLSGSVTGAPQGALSVSPSTIAVGNVTVGTSGTQTGTISASGASVTISSVSVASSEFAVSGLAFPVVIASGQSVIFTVTFTPQTSGLASVSASFISNGSNSPSAATLTGTGVAAPVYTVGLTWTASNSPNISGYNVYRRTGSSGNFVQINSSLDAATAYTDSSVADGQTYYYETTAVNSTDEESAPSASVKAVIPNP